MLGSRARPARTLHMGNTSLPVCSMLKVLWLCMQERDMCDDPAASYEFMWQLHRATMKNLVSAGPQATCVASP